MRCLCPTSGPPEYSSNIQDTLQLKDADLFLANGLGLDDGFADRMARNSGNGRLVYRKVGDEIPKADLIKE